MKASFGLILLYLVISVTVVQLHKLRGPVNALKKVGDCVTLECVTSSKNCDGVEWRKTEGAQTPRTVYTNGTILNGFSDGRYSVCSPCGCSLTITKLQTNDSGRFSCVLAVDAREETRSSILFVIDVTESCQSNVTGNTLNQYDSYSFWTAINVPAKSVEPSSVTLSFTNKAVGEMETMDDSLSQTVRTTLTGIARKAIVTQHVCKASLAPNTAAGFDNSTATIDVCTMQLIVSPVPLRILKGPLNALKNVGDFVTLDCVTNSKDCDMVEWKKLEGAQSARIVFARGIILNGFPRERYSVNSTGGCNLIITKLKISDSGRFSCVVLDGDMEDTRGSALVVINVTESCGSNVTGNALNQNDSYRFWTAIIVPPKSLEPSNVILSFHNMAVGETEKTDDSQPQIINTTLTGIARKENITPRVCRASLHPYTAAGFDQNTAPLIVCTTPQLNVSSVLTKGPVNALKKVGDSVTLYCVTSSENCDQVEWKKLEGAQSARIVFTRGIILNGFPSERYSVDSTDGCHLTIRELEVNDSGRFSCVLLVDDREETRGSVLVVINVTESCLSNVTSNALNQYDRYSFWTAINVPAKSLEPSNVTLYFLNKTPDDTETTADRLSQTVKTTLNGIARKGNITQRLCRASISPTRAADFDRSDATLDVCRTQQLNVSPVPSQILSGPVNALEKVGESVTLECVTSSYDCEEIVWKKMEGAQSARIVYRNGTILSGFPRERYSANSTDGCSLAIGQLQISDSGRFRCVLTVDDREVTRGFILVVITDPVEHLAFSPADGIFQEGIKISCFGYTIPPFLWKILPSVRVVQNGSSLNKTKGSFGHSFTCIATNTANCKEASMAKSAIIQKPSDGSGITISCIADGYPMSIFVWMNLPSGLVEEIGSIFNITKDSFGHSFTCVATHIVNGKEESKIMDEVVQNTFDESAVQSQTLKGPVNALKIVGDSVTLECVTSSKNCDQVEWKKLEGAESARIVFTRGIILNGFPGERYSVNSTDGCNLTIRELEVSDSGRFSCVLLQGDMEESRSSVLIVISVREACRSNVTSNALKQYDSYSFWTSINVPPKSVEPSNVILYFLNKSVHETETMDDSVSQTVKTTLNGIAGMKNITRRLSRASFPPTIRADFDRSTATLDICTTQQLSSVPLQILTEPANALKNVGGSITLDCVTSRKNCDMVEWKKLEGAQSARTVYTSGIILNGFPRERYSVNSTDGCNLTIRELEVNDSGRFSCVLLVEDREETRGSVLIVINVTESCRSNVTSNALIEGDVYSFWTAISVPPKSVEQSNVTLYFLNKTADETEALDNSQPLTVKTTLTGIARKENILPRVYRASLPPNTADGFTRSTATFVVCTTQQLIVSYPVENVIVWPNDGKFHKGDTINCTADGYPRPTFLWKNLTSGLVVQNVSSISITKDSFGHNFTCIATNTVNGRKLSMEKSVIVPKSTIGGFSSGYIAGITAPMTAVITAKGLTSIVWSNTKKHGGQQGRKQTSSTQEETTKLSRSTTTKAIEVSKTFQSQILKGPVNSLRKVGDSVMLECVTSRKNCDKVEWQKIEGVQSRKTVYWNGIMLNGFSGERYSVNSTGGCNLTITHLQMNDSGRFSCVLTVGHREETRSSVLVVISVREACLSNVTSNSLTRYDSYSFWTAINVPAKSLEPSKVILSFQDKVADEIETVDGSQPRTVKTTLAGIARKGNITQRVCLASFPPTTAADFDNSTATLDVCTTQQLIVSSVALQSQILILKGPVNAMKNVGDSVTLECVTSSSNCDDVEWKKVEGAQSARKVYTSGIILIGFPHERYGVNSTGGCSLTIRKLEINDSGRFGCVLINDDREETRSSVLVVISVRESCRSNMTSNALNQYDSYSFWTAIKVPAKSVEPSNVTLSFINKAVDETEITDEIQPQTVKTTLTGIARKSHITQRVCIASLPPNTAADFDRSAATLDVCITQQLIVSYPVESVTVWPNDGKFHEGNTISCTADGYPRPTFMWKNLTSGLMVQNGGSLNITKDSFGHNFTCIATNTVNGKKESMQMMAVIEKHSDESDTVKSQILRGPVNALKRDGDGESVTLECVTSSYDCEDVVWKKTGGTQSPLTVYQDGKILNGFPGERYSVNSTGGCNLKIRKLEIDDSGRFRCVLTVGDKTKTRGSVLVVIGLRAGCRSNVTSNSLIEGDGYSFWTTINVPAKSVEPSNVILSCQNKTVGEMETMDNSQSLTVTTTLTGIARKENITPRVCRASFPPSTEADFDNSTATLHVCTTQQLTMSNINDQEATMDKPADDSDALMAESVSGSSRDRLSGCIAGICIAVLSLWSVAPSW